MLVNVIFKIGGKNMFSLYSHSLKVIEIPLKRKRLLRINDNFLFNDNKNYLGTDSVFLVKLIK